MYGFATGLFLATALMGCDDTAGGADTAAGGGEAGVLSCTALITQAQLEGALGAGVDLDATSCEFTAVEGYSTGNINSFAGGEPDYESMLSGARASLGDYGTITETDDVGQRAFVFEGAPYGMATVEVGFLDSSGTYAVLVTTALDWAVVEEVHDIAVIIDDNIASL